MKFNLEKKGSFYTNRMGERLCGYFHVLQWITRLPTQQPGVGYTTENSTSYFTIIFLAYLSEIDRSLV